MIRNEVNATTEYIDGVRLIDICNGNVLNNRLVSKTIIFTSFSNVTNIVFTVGFSKDRNKRLCQNVHDSITHLHTRAHTHQHPPQKKTNKKKPKTHKQVS